MQIRGFFACLAVQDWSRGVLQYLHNLERQTHFWRRWQNTLAKHSPLLQTMRVIGFPPLFWKNTTQSHPNLTQKATWANPAANRQVSPENYNKSGQNPEKSASKVPAGKMSADFRKTGETQTLGQKFRTHREDLSYEINYIYILCDLNNDAKNMLPVSKLPKIVLKLTLVLFGLYRSLCENRNFRLI